MDPISNKKQNIELSSNITTKEISEEYRTVHKFGRNSENENRVEPNSEIYVPTILDNMVNQIVDKLSQNPNKVKGTSLRKLRNLKKAQKIAKKFGLKYRGKNLKQIKQMVQQKVQQQIILEKQLTKSNTADIRPTKKKKQQVSFVKELLDLVGDD
jgi:hypothetical protein